MLVKQAQANLKFLSVLTFLSNFRFFEGVIAVYFAAITGSFATAMAVLACMNLSSSFFEIPTGVFSDRAGRKKTIIISYFATTCAIFFYYLAHSALFLFIGALLQGFAMAMRSGTMSAYVYENLEIIGRESEFQRQEGHRQALGRYAMVVAGIGGTGIIYLFDIRTAVFLTLFVLFISFVLAFRLVDIRASDAVTTNIYAGIGNAWRSFITDKELRNVSIGQMIAQGGGNVEYRFRALFYATIASDWIVNLLGMLNNLFTGISSTYAHAIVRRSGFFHALVTAGIIDRVGTFFLVLTRSLPSAFLMSIVTSVVFGIRQIGAEDLLQKRYTKEQRATMGSLVGFGLSLIYGILGIVIGFLADRIGVMNTLLLLQPILLISSWFFFKGIKYSQIASRY